MKTTITKVYKKASPKFCRVSDLLSEKGFILCKHLISDKFQKWWVMSQINKPKYKKSFKTLKSIMKEFDL